MSFVILLNQILHDPESDPVAISQLNCSEGQILVFHKMQNTIAGNPRNRPQQ